MDRKKFFIVLATFLIFIIGVIGVFAFNEDLRKGLLGTLQDTVIDDALGVVGGAETEPENTDPAEAETPNKTEAEEDTNAEGVEEVKPRADDNLKVYIPNMAGSFVVVVSDGEAMLIDGGLDSDSNLVRAYLRDYLGIKHFRYIVVTNYHDDSIEGISKIMSYNTTDYILISDNVATHKNARNLRSYIEGQGLTWTVPSDNASFKLGDSKFRFVTSHDGGSLLTVLENEQDTMVFSSSITRVDKSVLAKLPEEVDIYSLTESTKAYELPTHLLDQINPKTVVFNDRRGIDPTDTINRISTHELSMYRSTQSNNIIIGSNGSSVIIDAQNSWR